MRFVLLCLSLTLSATPSWSQEAIGLAAPAEVKDSGLLQHILPRFSLKTGIRVIADDAGVMVLETAPPGDPVFARNGVIYHLRIEDSDRQARFLEWLKSDIGKRTVESFAPADGGPYSANFDIAVVESGDIVEGDTQLGEELSMTHCGRCHVIGPRNRMNGLGSTPSFAVLRAMPDWSQRFEAFFALNPHPAFTQIDGLTPPFDPERPSPIHPVEMTLDDLDAILAFVSRIDAADLGAPLKLQ
ncbi:cytochrome c [Ruegeria marisrubri]|uniref:c-type cytochrome n=1 Tax=Ruegeria marisrubri TaxID=1685379 RepID=UPI001CD25B7F|nr:cytochrome c [Ruegeria marisrubri]MCA0906323.1 cytochrome c [Ruegeria marisrubri]